MLRFAEEIILLLLGDEDGRFANTRSWTLDYAVAGAVLMDLALEDRIDTDLEHLILLDATPTGDELLDPTLREIAAAGQQDIRYWVEQTAQALGRHPRGRAGAPRRARHPRAAATTATCGCSGRAATRRSTARRSAR